MTKKGLIIAAFVIATGLIAALAFDKYGYIVVEALTSIADKLLP